MQTFLPFPNFAESARTLDSRRLNKQSVECYQIGLIIWRKNGWLTNPENKKGFWNHPAVKMWQGHENSFMSYWSAIITECDIRSIKTDTMRKRWWELEEAFPWNHAYKIPPWLGSDILHASHRSNLKRKDSEYYSRFQEPNNLPYYWPKNESLSILLS